MTQHDLLSLSLREQAARIASGDLKAERLMEVTLERVDAVNGPLNAIVSMRAIDELLAEARAVDRDGATGALAGMPTAIKDLHDAVGMPNSQGSPIYAGLLPETDDPHVAHMRAAGMIFVGKTNTPEFGLGGHTYNPVHGATANPYNLTVSCGGSSGGAAVALAAGMMSAVDGSDMMGSLRNPAGWCNVYGMRPTHGLVPGAVGDEIFLHKLSTRGPMGRCPDDMALLLDVMAGLEVRGALEPRAEGCRIGWLADWGGAWAMEPGVLSLCEKALGVFDDLGANVDAVAPPLSREVLWNAWVDLRAFTLASGSRDLYDDPDKRALMKPEAIWEVERGLSLNAMDVHDASILRTQWFRAAMELFERFDVLVLPSAQLWPFDLTWIWPRAIAGVEMDTYHRWMEVTIPASLLGLPVVSVPAGFGEAGLPMGLQLIGRPGADRQVLEVAAAYHEVTRWPQSRPPLISGIN